MATRTLWHHARLATLADGAADGWGLVDDGALLTEGDRIVWAGWRFEIVDMDGRRVDKVLAMREEVVA